MAPLPRGNVTVFPPGGAPEATQEWLLETLENGKMALQNPTNIFPSHSLSYEGEAEKGKRVVPGPISDFPTREWCVEVADERPLPIPYLIRVPEKELIVVVSPIRIFPPHLVLGSNDVGLDGAWVFELVRPE